MNVLTLEHVRRVYPPEQPGGESRVVLHDINLELKRGEVAALTGRSGTGKTTLLYLAAGLGQPSAGRVILAGQDLCRLGAAELAGLRRRRVALVFQNNLALSALPAWENAALPLLMENASRRDARKVAESVLERVGLQGLRDASTAMLSGGQRRRLGLARALLANPELLLADEPTADLDEITAQEIETLLMDWLRTGNRSALIVTHDSILQRKADSTYRLANGVLESSGAGD